MKKILGSVVLVAGLCFLLPGCGDSTSPADACSACPAEARSTCEQYVELCQNAGGGDDCADAARQACEGE